jgi:hypothetical protein
MAVVVPPTQRVASTHPGVFLSLLAREGHYQSCLTVVGEDRWFWMSSVAGGLLKTVRAQYTLTPATAHVTPCILKY